MFQRNSLARTEQARSRKFWWRKGNKSRKCGTQGRSESDQDPNQDQEGTWSRPSWLDESSYEYEYSYEESSAEPPQPPKKKSKELKQERDDDQEMTGAPASHRGSVKLTGKAEIDNAVKSRREFREAAKPMPGSLDSERHHGDADHPGARQDLTDMHCDPSEPDKLPAEFLDQVFDGQRKRKNFIVWLQSPYGGPSRPIAFVSMRNTHQRTPMFQSRTISCGIAKHPWSNGKKMVLGNVSSTGPRCTTGRNYRTIATAVWLSRYHPSGTNSQRRQMLHARTTCRNYLPTTRSWQKPTEVSWIPGTTTSRPGIDFMESLDMRGSADDVSHFGNLDWQKKVFKEVDKVQPEVLTFVIHKKDNYEKHGAGNWLNIATTSQ